MGQFLFHRSSLNPVPVSNLEPVVLKEVMGQKRGLTLLDLKKRSQHSSVTTMSDEYSGEQETPAGVEVLSFYVSGTRRLLAPGGHLVWPGDILSIRC